MSTAADAHPANRSATASISSAILLELEGAAIPVRPVLFEAARAYLAAREVPLDHTRFARFGGTVSTLAAQMAEQIGPAIDVAELAKALNNALIEQLNAGRLGLNGGVTRLLDAAARRGLPIAALTGLPESVAHAAFTAAGLESRGIQLFVFSDEEKPFPRADAWLKAAKQLGKTARFCVAIASTQATCKSALSAGLRTIAAPDAFTGHHDFSGADIVLDSWDDLDVDETLGLLIPALR
jgi:beta-phosphoglucomutase-like phosphatase (HAD superfamily)